MDTDQAETSISAETVREGSDVHRTFTVRRKGAKRSEPWYLAPPLPQNVAAPLSIPPTARKKPRLWEPLPTTTSPDDVSVDLPPPADDNDDPVTDAQPIDHPRVVRVIGRWTPEEDAKLTSAIANTNTCQKKHDGKEYLMDWVAVAALVPGRTNRQCSYRWNHIFYPSISLTTVQTGKWGDEEDFRLKNSVRIYGSKDWAAIAALVPGRTQTQCRNRWHSVFHTGLDPSNGPNGRTGKWREDEDLRLKGAMQAHSVNDWVSIAALVPSRTKSQCRTRWKHVLDPSIDPSKGRKYKWTKDENIRLKGAIEAHGDKDWVAIAALLPGRTEKQCRHRWHGGVLVPSTPLTAARLGRWGEEEDLRLKGAIEAHGDKNWVAIAALVPGRTQKQCWTRWKDVLDPSTINRSNGRTGKWTEGEVLRLKGAIQMHGDKDWAAIAALVPGRTRKQCSDRWKKYTDPIRRTVQEKALGTPNKAPALGQDSHLPHQVLYHRWHLLGP
jgi:hypothetical protein